MLIWGQDTTGRSRRRPGRILHATLTIALLVVVLPTAPARAGTTSRCGTYSWCNTSLAPLTRAHLLLMAMSQTDKVNLLTGAAAPDVGLPAVKFTDGALGAGGLGSGASGATAMPAGIALAANFDPNMAHAYGAVVGIEARHRGFDGVWGPTVNIMRTPLGGRTYEGYGEDPYLATTTSVGWINGLQAQGVMADVKHFAANNQEGQIGVSPLTGLLGGRLFVDAVVDQRTLHEIYFPAFEGAVKQAHVATVMCSYNQVNGQYACADPALLTQTLRQAWGFGGFVFSDAGACHETAADLAAGTNLDILGTCYSPLLVDLALADGSVSQATLDQRVLETLRTLFVYGFFDHAPYVANTALDNVAGDAAVADRVAAGGTVLLKNNGVLPLSAGKDHSIAVIGPAANQYIHGNGSSQVTPWLTTTALAGIQHRAAESGIPVSYADGSNVAQAVAAARRASVAIVVAADTESEGVDKPCMSLTPLCDGGQATPPAPLSTQLAFGNQDALIRAISAANPNTVVVLETGAPVLTPWRNSTAGLLEAWYPGEDGGTAVAHVLFGDTDPGGRLPATFPQRPGDIPTAGSLSSYPGLPGPQDLLGQETYSEGVMVGYRGYDNRGIAPAFPFGFGLSYTKFSFSNLAVASIPDNGTNTATVTLTVTNTGNRAGLAVPELYVGLPSPQGVPEPPQQLKGFDKVELKANQSRRVTFKLDTRSLSYWDTTTSSWRVAPGCDAISVGSSSRQLPLRGFLSQGGGTCPS